MVVSSTVTRSASLSTDVATTCFSTFLFLLWSDRIRYEPQHPVVNSRTVQCDHDMISSSIYAVPTLWLHCLPCFSERDQALQAFRMHYCRASSV